MIKQTSSSGSVSITLILTIELFVFILMIFIQKIDYFYIKAISGKSISIPCKTSEWDENEVLLVLWYRENSAVPFYKLDSRNRQLFKAKHLLISVDLSNRYYFDVTTDPPVLKINPVLIEDEGEYRCRVDYKKRRTQSFSTFLEVFGKLKNKYFCYLFETLIQRSAKRSKNNEYFGPNS